MTRAIRFIVTGCCAFYGLVQAGGYAFAGQLVPAVSALFATALICAIVSPLDD